MLAHLQQPPPRISERIPGLPSGLDAVIATAMAKDPAHRFQTAGHLAAAASAALHGTRLSDTGPWQARGPEFGAAAPWWQPAGEPRTQVAAGGVVSATHSDAHQPAPRRRRARRWIAAGLATAAVVAAGVAAAVVTSHRDRPATTSTTKARPLPISALHGLLPSADDISTIMGAKLNPRPAADGMSNDSDSLNPKDCGGPQLPAQRAAYQGSGWQAVAAQSWSETGVESAQLSRSADQAVVDFPTADLATGFVNSQKPIWAKCSNAKLTYTEQETTMNLTMGSVSTDGDGVMTITWALQGSGNWTCAHAMTARNNIVIDADACSFDKPEAHAIAIVEKIAAKVSAG
jgi:eukaryotic-like serine/threonine-protein kinase